MAQQTAVEWFLEELIRCGWFKEGQINITLEQAKQMEKEQIIKAACYDPFLGDLPVTEGEHYYDKTYSK